VRHQKWIAKSENLYVLRVGRYEAKGKDRPVTVLSEATQQREEWNLRNNTGNIQLKEN
jgi:hypothetical protein